MTKLHIFISYTHTGLGHKIPAVAIAEKIEESYPGKYKITLSNFFSDIGALDFNTFIEKSWDFLLKNPWFTKIILIISYIIPYLCPFYIKICHHRIWKKSMKYLENLNPDIIFTTHFFTYGVAIDSREYYRLKFPIIALNPDPFETYPQWNTNGDMLLVSSQVAYDEAIYLGHNPDKIFQVPQVIRKDFDSDEDINLKQLKESYQIRENIFTILMSDGGQGLGKMFPTIKQIIKLNIPINIIAICSKNQKLYSQLFYLKEKLEKKKSIIELSIFGFVDSIKPFIMMSDLFIGKSGPSTMAECLKQKLPIIVNFSAMSAEEKNVQFLLEQEVIWLYKNPVKLAKFLLILIKNPEYLKNARHKISSFNYLNDGSKQIAEIIVKTLEYNSNITDFENIKIIFDNL